ncbi:serine/threonine-protein kinase VRK1-like isoform X2 [Argiope bruennichi]|uniref:serine/threonine-protein kinase VRK1-like isoform X2 n=1 Tax=Argiope bruennichi TaxID=94029 RepID=UPI0024958B46|nr:serine/threonine-protein kinase VRK1-like isoform X2 [Argiope bruennichi]
MPPKPRRKAPAAAKGHKLPEPIPEGTEVTDTFKKSWKIGPKIGSGGFGTVYFASEADKKDYDYVVKVEYHDNGPLFAEMHCYHSIGKPAQLAEWVKKKKLTYLGLSPCYGFGSFEYNNSKYRFMIIERFDKDLQKLFEENGKRFPLKVVYQIGLSLLNVLEYIHTAGYIHGDIKAANLLLGRKKGTENQVYLVDMGLACKYLRDGVHKKEMPDPKKAHNGTPEFTSRDAHRGCFSRRSDLEILCYNLLQWLSGELPWEKYIGDDKKLQQEKERYMQDIDGFLAELFGDENCPVGIKKLLTYICKLSFEEEPDYNFCRKALRDELKRMGCENDTALDFQTVTKKAAANAKTKKEPVLTNKENTKATKTSKDKRKPESEVQLPPGIIPTPAMLEIMNKKTAEDAKPTKARRKK